MGILIDIFLNKTSNQQFMTRFDFNKSALIIVDIETNIRLIGGCCWLISVPRI
jgi:hypothetical protein